MMCRHRYCADYERILDDGRRMEYRACLFCGSRLPLGPSDETPVAIEVRAAELFACANHGADEPDARCRCYRESHLLPDPHDEAEARRLYREMWEVER